MSKVSKKKQQEIEDNRLKVRLKKNAKRLKNGNHPVFRTLAKLK